MYVNFWPIPYGSGSNQQLPMNSQQPLPPGQVARSRSQIWRTAKLAAQGYIDAQTVGPGMTRAFMNSTGQANEVAVENPQSTAATFAGAPNVTPLNPTAWQPPLPAMATCGDHFVPGVPWADSIYRPVPGSMSAMDWIKAHPWLAVAAVAAGGFGLYNLGRKR